MVVREACPQGGLKEFTKNGHIHNGKQNHLCKAWGSQFVFCVTNRTISEEQRALVERLLCEKIFLHSICRAVDIGIPSASSAERAHSS